MKGLIIFSTSHGTTEKAAEYVSSHVNLEMTLVNIKKEKVPSLDGFDVIVIGTSIHIGQIPRKMRRFLMSNEDLLLTKTLALYLCCMHEGEERQKQFEASFPNRLRSHASACGLFGGELIFSRMSYFEKLMIKKAAKVTEDQSTFDEKAIKGFTAKINQSLISDPAPV
ncbi:flavodoxin domain-containing protein [Salipaludibacillus sp. CUR1]|uniref:flavodoxin domain-containing protein n=1 Tax=Salipaludibacillus sp. CUR1 TaxID=2820003 RepID=UPI001E53D4BB|nr:flavodoxin domain-containing protein [Salipaludibacillus sp. CUR1]MCE7791922.1 flavodoxin domain-containing protein [Salipaludibacillus sp. CUR1]